MYLVFDIGGTNMRIGISSDCKTLIQTKSVPTPQNFEEGIKTFKKLSEELSLGEKIDNCVIGVAGSIDKDKTMLVSSPHIGGWIQKPLKLELEKALGCSVLIEHDADLQGLAEASFGAGKGYKIVANLVIGTGIATTRIVHGKIDRNALGFEGGHHIIVADGNVCDCGGKGHFEAYVSGSGIERAYGKRGKDIKDPKVWDDLAKYMAVGLNNVTVFWSPDIIVLGGVVMKSIPIEAVRKYFKEFLTIFPKPPEVVLGKLGDDSGLLGALSLINQS